MKPRRSVVLGCALALVPAMLRAQATRTWVSGVGDDANPCSRTAPCQTFAGAITKTAAGGEISVLDPGGFGAVTITKSITINGDGTLASILGSNTNGIIVNAGANDKVILRSLSINGAGTGINGIRYLAGGSLTIENSTIYGFTSNGIDVSLANNGRLFVGRTTIANVCSGGGTCAGVMVKTTAGTAQAALDGVRIVGSGVHGIEVANLGQAAISHSDISHSFNAGVKVSSSTGLANIEDTMLSYNNSAVFLSVANARARISNSTIVNNIANGVTYVGGAIFESTGDNRIAGNPSSLPPTATYTQQ